MTGWALPVAAAGFWAGLLAWDVAGGLGPPWAFLVLGAAGLAGAAIAAPSSAPPPEPLDRSGVLRAGEPASLTAVAPQRTGPGRGPPLVVAALAVTGLVLLGAGWGGLREQRLDASPLARLAPARVDVVGTLRTDPAPGLYGWSAAIGVSSVAVADGPAVPLSEGVWVQGEEAPPAAARGDRVQASGLVERVEGEFGGYLRGRRIVVTLRADEVRRLGPSSNPLVRIAQSARAFAARSAERLFPEREAGLLLGLALGDDTRLDPALERDFRATGLGHLLVVSGSNVAMVLAPVLSLAVLMRLPPAGRFAAGAGTIAFFVVLTGAEPSVLRAGLMAGLALFGVLGGRVRSTASVLAGAVLALLCVDPGLVHSVGFQLSVAATAGMVALASPIAERLRWLPAPVALAAGATLAAQLGVTPLLLFHFREVPGTTVLANLLAFPAVGPALLLGLGAVAAGAVWFPLGRVVAAVALVPMRALETIADRLARAPVPSLSSGGGVPVLVVGTLIVVLLAWRLRTGRRVPRSFAAVGAVVVPVLVWSVALSAGPPQGLEVRFLDVGQGDAALVTSPAGARILVDGGPEPDEVARELAALGVRRIDLLVASHPHADHIVGLPAVLARFAVGLAIEPGCPDDSAIGADLRRAFVEEGVRVVHPRAGDAFTVGDLGVDVLSPPECFTGTESDPNNDALVLRVSWRESTVLFATEPEEPAQQEMLDSGALLHADVLKVPHHGAATSLPEFFDAVAARVAVVSVGENSYGHPVPETLDTLEETGARVLRTDLAGDVTVTFAPGGLRVASDPS